MGRIAHTHCQPRSQWWYVVFVLPACDSSPSIVAPVAALLHPYSAITLLVTVSSRAGCRTLGASLPLAQPPLFTAGAPSYNQLWQEFDLAVVIFQGAISLLVTVSPRAGCRTLGASLPLAQPPLFTAGAPSYNQLWQDVGLAVVIFQGAMRRAATGTAFDVSGALGDALCRGIVSRLPHRPTGGPRPLVRPMGCSLAHWYDAPRAPPSS